MNRSDAQHILNALRPLNVERQLVLLTWLSSPVGTDLPTGMSREEHRVLDLINDTTTSEPWRNDDDTFWEVIEALETDMVGICEACGKYTALKNGFAAGSEVSACKWGCR